MPRGYKLPTREYKRLVPRIPIPLAPKIGTRYEEDRRIYEATRVFEERDQYAIAELGDTYETIGAKYDFDPTTLAQINPDISTPTAGGAINLTQPPTPTPAPRVLLDTAETTPEGIQYPEGWNMAKLQAAIYGGGGVMDFASKFYSGYYTEQGGQKEPLVGGTVDYYTKLAEGAYSKPTEELPAWPGLPSTHAWEKDPETGRWDRSPHESVFDELYVMNGIDPTDPDMIEWFWGFADEDLLFAGELFDVIDFGDEGSGYGGYGTAPSYKDSGFSGRGQKPQRGDYASYLQLSSWSI